MIELNSDLNIFIFEIFFFIVLKYLMKNYFFIYKKIVFLFLEILLYRMMIQQFYTIFF